MHSPQSASPISIPHTFFEGGNKNVPFHLGVQTVIFGFALKLVKLLCSFMEELRVEKKKFKVILGFSIKSALAT